MGKFNVIIEKDEEGWFISDVVELPGCHTQARTIDQLIERTKEAIKAYLETEQESELKEEFVGIQQIEV
ncbi:MAG: type II toxin-antitoxin system HicB family antitoxin [Nanoarchaeota archaeon]